MRKHYESKWKSLLRLSVNNCYVKGNYCTELYMLVAQLIQTIVLGRQSVYLEVVSKTTTMELQVRGDEYDYRMLNL